jgi:predicted RNA-binding Zn ribbon-like protein
VDDAFRLYYGAAWLNFVATLTGRLSGSRIERLSSPARLGEWFAAVGLTPRERPTDRAVDAAIELREAFYELASAVVDGRRPAVGAVRLVNRALAQDAAPALRAANGGLSATPPPTARAAMGRLARQAAEQLVGPERARLRKCADAGCAGIYLDETGRRRWCSDRTCGVRARVRAHRARATATH